ncbi:hypothetical protein G7Y89_g3964 [Cudoniella acicularis]|uniref:Major facilitator superfamily (MFS) profile domain-containing protein n=1 Tax=Cudoniella acicularis TaxID=354080 RepID=A0A8H4RR68_9HELO|nr:hypothetical protein G7Y89_g3964 [Cudoniella acicularis]
MTAEENDSTADEKYEEEDTAWLQVLMAHLLLANTWGYINSFSIFEDYYILLFQRSPSEISWVGSLQIFLTFFLGTFSGMALDAGLYRYILFIGPFLQVLGILITSFSNQYWQLIIMQGIVQGVGDGLLFCPTIAILSTYFNKKRSMAIALAGCGAATGGIIFPVIAQQLLPRIGFSWTLRVMGLVVAINGITANIYSRTRIIHKTSGPLFDWRAFKSARYTMFSLAIFLISTFAREVIHVSTLTSRTILIIMNAVGIPGRIIPAILADGYFGPAIGSAKTLVPVVLCTTIILYCWIAVKTMAALVPFVVFYGVSAGIQSLFPAALSSLTEDPRQMGVRMGMIFSIAGIGSLAGPPIAGAFVTMDKENFLYAQIFAGTTMLLGGLILLAEQFTGNLSIDLLIEVAEWVGTDSHDKQTGSLTIRGAYSLAQLSRCSRRWNRAAEHVLLRVSHLSQASQYALPGMLKRFMANYRFAAPIKKFTCNCSWEQTLDMSRYTEEDFKACEQRIGTISIPAKDITLWATSIRAGEWDAVTALLLSFLFNLEELEVTIRDPPSSVWPNRFHLRNAAKFETHGEQPRSFLDRLHSLSVACSAESDSDLSFITVLPYLSLASIDSLSIDRLSERTIYHPPLESKITSVKSLALHRCLASATRLHSFFQDFTALERLYYDVGKRHYADYAFLEIFTASIAHLAPCLKELVVLNDFQWLPEIGWFSQDSITLWPLPQLHQLQTLVVFSSFLFNKIRGRLESRDNLALLLPRNLQKLELRGCRDGVIQHLVDIQSDVPRRLPALREIVLEFVQRGPDADYQYHGYQVEIADKLTMALRSIEVDIVFKLVKFPDEGA